MELETDLKKIMILAEEKEFENWKFRTFLKECDIPSKELDSIVHDLFKQVSVEIDCKECSNCCKEVTMVLDNKDIDKFAKGLKLTGTQFTEKYLIKDEEGDIIFNKKPCPFLNKTICSYYDYCPKDCKSYPNLHKNDFISRLIGVIENYSICPIIFNVYELLKMEVWDSEEDEFSEFNDYDDYNKYEQYEEYEEYEDYK